MQISNVLAGYSDPAALGKQAPPLQPAGGRLAPSAAAPLSSPAAAAAVMSQILSKYDVTDISPLEFSEMIQKLSKAGVLSEGELQELAALRLDLDSAGVEPDQSMDLLEFYTQKVAKAQREFNESDDRPARAQQLSAMLRRLDWLQKFAVLQSSPEAIGVNAVV